MQNFRQAVQSLDLPRISRWGAMVGAVALLIALIIFLVEEKLTDQAFAALIVGVVGLGVWLLIAPDELRGWLSGRQIYYGTGTVVVVVIFIGLVSAGYALVERQQITGDLTTYQKFTLDRVSLDAVDRMTQRMVEEEQRAASEGFDLDLTVKLVAFYPRSQLREREAADIILRQFVDEGEGQIVAEYVDPDENPLVASQYNYGLASSDGSLIGPLFLTIVDQNDATYGFQPLPIGQPNERSIATAMVQLLVAGQFKIYFMTGHVESDTFSEAGLGLSKAIQALGGLGIGYAELNLALVEEVPEDASALIIAGPHNDYSETDIAKLDAYMQGGGRMLIAADPPYVDQRVGVNSSFISNSLFNQYLWNEFGVRFRADLVSDITSSQGNEFNPLISRIVNHTALAAFPNVFPIFTLARSVETLEEVTQGIPEEGTNQGVYVRTPLLVTSDDAFGERGVMDETGEPSLALINLDNPGDFTEGIDTDGPLYLGVVAEYPTASGSSISPRLILLGDTDWMGNNLIDQQGNAYLWSDLISWLISYDEVAAPPAATRPDLLPVTLSDQERGRIQLVTLILLPGIVLALGVLVWGTRRRN